MIRIVAVLSQIATAGSGHTDSGSNSWYQVKQHYSPYKWSWYDKQRLNTPLPNGRFVQ